MGNWPTPPFGSLVCGIDRVLKAILCAILRSLQAIAVPFTSRKKSQSGQLS